jgi:hypothetical protein
MKPLHRIVVAAVLVSTAAATPLLAHASSGKTLSWNSPVTFDGGPLVGTYKSGVCLPVSCSAITVNISDSVAKTWTKTPGGVVATIAWRDPNAEIDLFAYDDKLNVLDQSNFGGITYQRVFIANPRRGAYQFWAESFSGQATTFTGTVALVQQPTAHVLAQRPSMQWSPPAVVDPQITTGEPGIRNTASGQSFVDAPWRPTTGSSMLWRSQPAEGDLTYQLLQAHAAGTVNDPRPRNCSTTTGGTDADATALPDGRLLFADLDIASVSIARSDDDGATWSCGPVSASTPDVDRPWLAAAPNADGAGPGVDAYLTYRAYALSGQFATGLTSNAPRIQVDVSRDDGQTWTPAASIGDAPGRAQAVAGAPVYVKDPGPVFTDSAGRAFVPFASPNGRAYIARSVDGARTWTVSLIAQRGGTPDYGFVAGAADSAGNLYVAWVDQGTFAVVYSVSADHGLSWSPPRQVNQPGTVAAMAWVAAGRSGDVAIGWYGAATGARPDLASGSTQWFPYVARSLDAPAARPHFQTTAVTTAPVHQGPLCVPDLPPTNCPTKQFGDLMMVAMTPARQLRASFDDDAGGSSAPFVETAVQTSGSGMADAVTANETRGDAVVSGNVVPQLDFVAQPSWAPTSSGARVTVPLADAHNLGAAAAAYDAGTGSEAVWLLTWRTTDGGLRYAGLRIDNAGPGLFFGGRRPVAVAFGPDSSYASYPDATPATQPRVTGAVDVAQGALTLNIPSWLAGGAALSSLQAWSLVGDPQHGQPQPLVVADSTPPRLNRTTPATSA